MIGARTAASVTVFLVGLYLIAVGTAMISVVVAKKKPKYGFMPLTYM